MTQRMMRVIVLDDHPIILDGLSSFVSSQPGYVVVARCQSPSELVGAVAAQKPDLGVFDIKTPEGETFETVKTARAVHPDMKVVFLSGHDDDLYIERAFEVGASGFVLKSSPLPEIMEAIRTVGEGGRYVSDEVLTKVEGDVREAGGYAVRTRLSLLTPREREVLQKVSLGLSAREISEELKISTWTVTNHKANIMSKLGIHNQVGLTRFALSTGLTSL